MKRLLFILSFAFLTVNAQEDANPLKVTTLSFNQ